MKKRITSILSLFILSGIFFVSCQPDANKIPPCFNGVQDNGETGVDCGGTDCAPCPPTCNDGVQNQGETEVDCGGPNCEPCPTCFDGIQNGDEEGVDCGGTECLPCPATCDDQMMNGQEEGVDCGGPDCVACNPNVLEFSATIDGEPMEGPIGNGTILLGTINVTGNSGDLTVSITFAANIDPGSYSIPVTASGFVSDNSVSPPILFIGQSGDLIILTHDKANKTISGTFTINGLSDTGDAIEVSNGSFSMSY